MSKTHEAIPDPRGQIYMEAASCFGGKESSGGQELTKPSTPRRQIYMEAASCFGSKESSGGRGVEAPRPTGLCRAPHPRWASAVARRRRAGGCSKPHPGPCGGRHSASVGLGGHRFRASCTYFASNAYVATKNERSVSSKF